MSALTVISAVCHQDLSVSAHAVACYEKLAEALETFDDKQQIDAIKDVHDALLDIEEITAGMNPEENVDLVVSLETDGVKWDIDQLNPMWQLDIRMSIFHKRLIMTTAAPEVQED